MLLLFRSLLQISSFNLWQEYRGTSTAKSETSGSHQGIKWRERKEGRGRHVSCMTCKFFKGYFSSCIALFWLWFCHIQCIVFVWSAKFKSLLTSMKGLQNQLDMSLKEVEVLKESRERQMNMVCIKDIYYCISRSWCTISQLYRQHYYHAVSSSI